MADNRTITRAVLSKREVNSLLALQQKVEFTVGSGITRVSQSQLKAMQKAYNAIKLLNGVPPEIVEMAKNLGLET